MRRALCSAAALAAASAFTLGPGALVVPRNAAARSVGSSWAGAQRHALHVRQRQACQLGPRMLSAPDSALRLRAPLRAIAGTTANASRRLQQLRSTVQGWLRGRQRALSIFCIAFLAAFALFGLGAPVHAADAASAAQSSRGAPVAIALPRFGRKARFSPPGASIPNLEEFRPAKLPLEQFIVRDIMKQVTSDPTVDMENYRIPGDAQYLKPSRLFDSRLGKTRLEEKLVLEQRYWTFRTHADKRGAALRDVVNGLKWGVVMIGAGFAVVWTVREALRLAKEEEIELYGEELSVDATEIEPQEVRLSGLDDDEEDVVGGGSDASRE